MFWSTTTTTIWDEMYKSPIVGKKQKIYEFLSMFWLNDQDFQCVMYLLIHIKNVHIYSYLLRFQSPFFQQIICYKYIFSGERSMNEYSPHLQLPPEIPQRNQAKKYLWLWLFMVFAVCSFKWYNVLVVIVVIVLAISESFAYYAIIIINVAIEPSSSEYHQGQQNKTKN